jgi:hypothetical protein
MGDRRAAWAATIGLSLAMLMVPAGFAVLLSADGGEASGTDAPAAAAGRSKSDRAARMTFHLRDGALGMRILRGAPRETRLVRGREVRVLCGSVSGLVIRDARWPAGADTLRVTLPARELERAEFCALKRGRLGIARVVLR